MRTASERRELLKAAYHEGRGCVACQLHETRCNVVFGAGNADAELMFVGEAPGANEDQQGLPFVGQAGKLLEKLLGEIGMQRTDVFIANTLMCRPPGNRDPHPHELEACRHHLYRKLELIEPAVICTLGNFATKLLRGEPTGISRIHGQPEVRTIGPRTVRLYPLYHPAAALYTPSTLELLRTDFLRIPEILALGAPDQLEQSAGAQPGPAGSETPSAMASDSPGDSTPEPSGASAAEPSGAGQLGLF